MDCLSYSHVYFAHPAVEQYDSNYTSIALVAAVAVAVVAVAVVAAATSVDMVLTAVLVVMSLRSMEFGKRLESGLHNCLIVLVVPMTAQLLLLLVAQKGIVAAFLQNMTQNLKKKICKNYPPAQPVTM
jgi:sorbitol-specific phosphotransferase system component IIBC